MTLPSSGAISLSQVNTELGLSSTATISLNDTNVRTLAGISSGTISMSNLLGKSWVVPVDYQVYSGGAGGGGYNANYYGQGAGGGAAGVRFRSGSAVNFTAATDYQVIIGAGGGGAADTGAAGGRGGRSALYVPGYGLVYATHDGTSTGYNGQGGAPGGHQIDQSDGTSATGYGGQGGGCYVYGQAGYIIGGQPNASPYSWGGGGGSAMSNNGGISSSGNLWDNGAPGQANLTTSSIIGISTYGGGGGGGAGVYDYNYTGYLSSISGGSGVGGSGSGGTYTSNAGSATANTGGGGGGAGGYSVPFGYSGTGGNGGSGCVFIQYPDSYPALTHTGSMENLGIVSGYRRYKLTSSGNFRIG